MYLRVEDLKTERISFRKTPTHKHPDVVDDLYMQMFSLDGRLVWWSLEKSFGSFGLVLKSLKYDTYALICNVDW